MNMPQKRILLINSHFGVGGIQSSLINMANELCEFYSVDLLVYYPEGPMKERLDSRVNIIKSSFAFMAMGMSLKTALKSGNFLIILFKLLGTLWSRVFDNRLPIFIATKIQPELSGYDLAIAFRQEASKSELASGFIRVLQSCVEAKKKIAWIHCDSTQFPENQSFNRKYYKNIDTIVGVSQSVANAFKSMNPEFSNKMDYCYNFLDYGKFYEKSKEEQQLKYPEDKFICFSACRLGAEKGLVRGIKAMAPVFKENNDIMWYIAGDGPERENIEAAIEQEGLHGRVILLGNQSNPYPYMKNADLYISLSFHEAAPMVYTEAKALGVPVFTTRTLSSDEMLQDGVNAFICENNDEGIFKSFSEVISNKEKAVEIKKRWADYVCGNEESMRKIAEWIKSGG